MNKMIRSFLPFLFTLVIIPSFAQDTIYKYSAEKVVVKITEISPTEIKYKRFDFQDGPLYTESKNDIKMIIYANGLRETFAPVVAEVAKPAVSSNANNQIVDLVMRYRYQGHYINQPQTQKIITDTGDPKIQALVADAKLNRRREFIGFAAIPFGALAVGGALWGISGFRGNSDGVILSTAAVGLAGVIACPIASGIFRGKKQKANSAAIRLYNEQF
jgi:hypothetical protein